MDKIEICKKIKKTIRSIVLFDNDNIISSGTGIVIRNTGTLLTAGHVIEDYSKLSNPKIIVSGLEDIPRTEYKPLLHNPSFDINMPNLINPLKIDLAILEPEAQIKNSPFLELDNDIAVEGEEVIMAGFPDEVKLPLNFDKALNFDNSDLGRQELEIKNFFTFSMRLIMIKSGMVGSVQKIDFSGKSDMPGIENISISGATYWIDNASTYGASGGPVVNSDGKLIGIICEKGLTIQRDLDLEIPSGSTMALSHKLITWWLDYFKNRANGTIR